MEKLAPTSIIPNHLYSAPFVARVLSCNPATIGRAVRQKRIEAVYIGHKLRIRGSAILDILANGLPPVHKPEPTKPRA